MLTFQDEFEYFTYEHHICRERYETITSFNHLLKYSAMNIKKMWHLDAKNIYHFQEGVNSSLVINPVVSHCIACT